MQKAKAKKEIRCAHLYYKKLTAFGEKSRKGFSMVKAKTLRKWLRILLL
jgi:hypothetical protein